VLPTVRSCAPARFRAGDDKLNMSPMGPQSQIHGCEPAFSVADPCVNFFPLITFRTRATNRCVDRDPLTGGLMCTISCMKKKFSKRIGCGCTVHSSLNSTSGDRSQVPKLPPQSSSTFWKVAYASCSSRAPANPGGTRY
jgi:hypothetical protein